MPSRNRVRLGQSSKGNESPPVVADDKNSGDVALKKPRRGATSTKSKSAGKLARMLELPLEIFTEIASYMSPDDILQLARSTKALREKLMSKTSKHMWLAARSSMGVPDLNDFSEPHYADLLFSTRCHGKNCDDNHAMRVSFALGIRLCKKCFEHETFSEAEIGCDEKYHSLLLSFPGTNGYRFHDSTIKTFIEKLGQCKSPEEKEKAIADVKANTDRLNESAKRVELWCAALFSARRQSITERLLVLGYSTDDLDAHHDKEGWKWETLINEPRLLTETIWKKILPQLEETLSMRKALHRLINRKNLLRSIEDHFNSNLSFLEHMDGESDQITSINLSALYRCFPEIQAMLDDPDCVAPVPDNMWTALDESFYEVLFALSEKVEDECAVAMETAYQIAGESNIPDRSTVSHEVPPPILLRASSFFKHGRKLMSYAGVLKLRADTPLEKRQEEWHKEVPEGVIGMAKTLLRSMSFPETTSMLSLEKLGRVFSCQRCLRYDNHGEQFAWSGLVQHFYEKNRELEDRMRKREELAVDVPLRNEHDLVYNAEKKKTFVFISRYVKDEVESALHDINDEDDNSYAKLSEYELHDWGYNSHNASCRVSHDYDPEEVARAECDDDESDEETMPVWTKGDNVDWSCKWCAKLGDSDGTKWYSEASDLGKHMRKIHGTDFDGVPLVPKLKATKSV